MCSRSLLNIARTSAGAHPPQRGVNELKQTRRPTAPSVLLTLTALAGTSAVHASQCSAAPTAILQDSLLTPSGPDAGSDCAVNMFNTALNEDAGRGVWDGRSHDWYPHGGSHYGHHHGHGHGPPPPVPLPPAILLFASGAAGLLGILGRRRSVSPA